MGKGEIVLGIGQFELSVNEEEPHCLQIKRNWTLWKYLKHVGMGIYASLFLVCFHLALQSVWKEIEKEKRLTSQPRVAIDYCLFYLNITNEKVGIKKLTNFWGGEKGANYSVF